MRIEDCLLAQDLGGSIYLIRFARQHIRIGLGWVGWLVGLGRVGLGWVGWLVGLGWAGLGWVGLGWVELGWVGLVGRLVGWLVWFPRIAQSQSTRRQKTSRPRGRGLEFLTPSDLQGHSPASNPRAQNQI